MKKLYRLIPFLVLASLLAACNVPTPTNTPLSPANLPPTASPPPTVTPVSGEPVTLAKISMLDENNGWAWANGTDNTSRLLRTRDGGKTWQDVSPQSAALAPGQDYFLDKDSAWVSTFDSATSAYSLLYTSDGGQSWTPMTTSALADAFYSFTDPQNGRALTADVGAGNAYYRLYTTSDGGKTWAPDIVQPLNDADSSLPEGVLHLCNLCGDTLSFDSLRVVITYGDLASEPGGAVRLAISTNQGQTWKSLALPLPSTKYKDGMVAPASPHFFGSAEGVLPVSISQFSADGSQAYAVLAFYYTQDGGQTWAPAPALAENVKAFAALQIVSQKDIFVICGSQLCASHDAAQSWQTLALPASPENGLQLDFASPAAGWLVAYDSSGNGASTLYQTQDGGMTWNQLTPMLLP